MVVIKVYSQDVYAAAEASEAHTAALEKLLKLKPNTVFFIGGDSTLIAKGIEQANWFTYLEVELPVSLNEYRAELAKYLHEAFTNYGVHTRIKFINFSEEDIVTFINTDYKTFNDIIIEVDTNYEEVTFPEMQLDDDWDK